MREPAEQAVSLRQRIFSALTVQSNIKPLWKVSSFPCIAFLSGTVKPFFLKLVVLKKGKPQRHRGRLGISYIAGEQQPIIMHRPSSPQQWLQRMLPSIKSRVNKVAPFVC